LTKKRKQPQHQAPKPPRESVFTTLFREDLAYWIRENPKIALRAFDLIEDILHDPFKGLGKPEPLKYLAANTWARRLTEEHRLVYRVQDDRIDFLQVCYHY
jgi:toxin YoeB